MQTEARFSSWELMKHASKIYSRVGSHGMRLNCHERLRSVFRPLYAPFDELLQWIPEKACVVDIGCGSGVFLFLSDELKSLGLSYGIDVNTESIELARLVCTSSHLDFLVGMQVKAEILRKASVVTLIDVLHHIPKSEKSHFLQSILKGMSAGARVLIKDLDPKPAWKALTNRVTDFLSTRSKVNYISRQQIEQILSEEGFDVLASKRLDKYCWSHYLVVGQK